MKTTFFTLVIALFFSVNSANSTSFDPPTAVEVVEVDFPIFKDKDFKIIYIDFELLNSNVKSLQIIKGKSKVHLNDDLSKVNVDAIYEIDYTDYAPGTYNLELQTYSGKILNSKIIIK